MFPRDVARWNQWPNIPADWPLLPMVGQPMPSIYFTAGAEHRRHVAMVEPALELVDTFELRRTCEDLADRLIDAFCGRGEAELVADYAEPLPVLALARILGFPDEDGPRVAWTMKTLADGGSDAQAAHQQFAEHMQHLLATKKAARGAELVSWMLARPGAFTCCCWARPRPMPIPMCASMSPTAPSRRTPATAHTAQNLVRRPSAFLRGMTSLPVRFTPVRAVGGTP
ncbi:cytochrome P450 [Nocardia gipuzkoensis]|uniref:cytochrome P450 n=1 Tax=Nocardia gipuzkoensis TaxID=2749991 RepID=UPI001F22A209|nr:cytochrome P450 [Nocardia gipuzkoensis]